MEGIGEPALVASLRAHRGEVTCADACGARLVSGGGDRSLRLWRWSGAGGGWQEAGVAPAAHRYGVTAARWSGGGALVASGGIDGCVRLWEGRMLGARRLLSAPGAAAVRALCWAGGGAGGGRLVAGHDDGTLCVWLVARGCLVARLVAHEGALHALAAPARGALLLTACTSGVLKVFDFIEVCKNGLDDGTPPPALTWVDGAHDLGALCADASEDGEAAATGGQDGVVRVWRRAGAGGVGLVAAGAMEGHAAAVTSLRWGGGGGRGSLVASGSLDRTARLWAPLTCVCLTVLHAHARYLTCVALDYDLRYLITGSNDRSVRTWSLGTFTIDDELEVPCVTLSHFGVGDLEGIGPVECDDFTDEMLEEGRGAREEAEGAEGSGARRVWHAPRVHTGAINCIATHHDLLATASSDGTVKVFRWSSVAGTLVEEATLEAHRYPALAVDFGAGGALLLTAGLDARACLWDVQTGLQLRELSVPSGGGRSGETGGGGVRGARVSPHRSPRLLLATDDGLAPLWSLADVDPHPSCVYSGHTEAVTCCAWSHDGRVAATGAASGELRVLAPPAPLSLYHEPTAHDLGVQSCDFAPECASVSLALGEGHHVLATAGCDSLIKLWRLHCTHTDTEGSTDTVLCSIRAVRSVEAHGGGVTCVRWGREAAPAGAVLVSAGADRWARVWHVAGGGCELAPLYAVPAAGAGGALAVAVLGPRLLAVGALAGELALWRAPPALEDDDVDEDDAGEGAAPRFWSSAGVAQWLREYVTRPPGSTISRADEAELVRLARDADITGVQLLDDDLDKLLETLGYGSSVAERILSEGEEEQEQEKRCLERAETRDRLREELAWLRRAPPPHHLEASAPHELLCPLTHRLMREPAAAADGFTYDRANILEWLHAANPEGAVSPVSGRRLRSARVAPNHAARARLREHLINTTQD